MQILLVHNYYQRAGGEDAVLRAERQLLQDHGHNVVLYVRDNSEIEQYSAAQRLRLLKRAVWAGDTYDHLHGLVSATRPTLVHFHNTFPLVSPAAWYACRNLGIPVVQTLHNYRWLCPNALFYRDGHTCEDCLSTAVPWPAIVHACYRDSHVQSAAVATVLVAHRFLESFSQAVDAFIALTEFAREKFVGAGLPEDAIHVKPNFLLPDPGVGPAGGDYVLFVGRLSIEKGVHTLLEAWRNLDGIPLKIAGDGPLLEEARRLIDDWKLGNVELLGHRTPEELIDLYKGARFLVFPSECYENLPVTLAEAYASGLPVIGSRIGSIAEIVQDGVTGILFAPGDAHELADASARLWNNADVCERLSLGARLEFESKYEAGGNYQSLMKIYDYAIRHAERRANG